MGRSNTFWRRLEYWISGAGAATAIVGACLWYLLLSPYGYAPPPGLAQIDTTHAHRVFAYGTLRYRPVRWLVIGDATIPRMARLSGFRADGLNVVADAAARVDGVVFEVTAAGLKALDRYERLGIRYERVEMTLDDGETAWVYRRLKP
ncbi:gamma-glutamylcyclotransferase [Azoarcus sp. L1K30]|uniref:gamma-glutamylcyclotransferase family protein n=1 Tax=Azoarcus sp. L1K30 TaxID=2820277 RepID=UPI001B83B90D|nr:gamma-glutamylcyclotransferase family protein [Azoarcus sp. L1K30]MBR0567981.1 gamma-glutamylcyclotransferase [Azoarcus sp. L1K30]